MEINNKLLNITPFGAHLIGFLCSSLFVGSVYIKKIFIESPINFDEFKEQR